MGVLESAREAFARVKREPNGVPTEGTADDISVLSDESPAPPEKGDGWTHWKGRWYARGCFGLTTPFDQETHR